MSRAPRNTESNTIDKCEMKIGEVSKRSGVGIEALRFYEKSGLLDRPGRTYSGYRVYGEDVLERIAFIKRAQILGFTLDEIKQLIDSKRKGESPCAEVRETVRIRLRELDGRISQMIKYRDELSANLRDSDKKEQNDGHVCGLIENSEIDNPIVKKKI